MLCSQNTKVGPIASNWAIEGTLKEDVHEMELVADVPFHYLIDWMFWLVWTFNIIFRSRKAHGLWEFDGINHNLIDCETKKFQDKDLGLLIVIERSRCDSNVGTDPHRTQPLFAHKRWRRREESTYLMELWCSMKRMKRRVKTRNKQCTYAVGVNQYVLNTRILVMDHVRFKELRDWNTMT